MHIYSKKIDYDKHILLSTIKIYYTNMSSAAPPPPPLLITITMVSPGFQHWQSDGFNLNRMEPKGATSLSIFFITVMCLPSLNKGVTLPYLKEHSARFFFKNKSACMTSQHDWWVNFLASQVSILAGCCPFRLAVILSPENCEYLSGSALQLQ